MFSMKYLLCNEPDCSWKIDQ